MKKLVLGIVGEIAAGKTTVTDYFKEKYNAETFRFSDMLRDVLDRMHIEKSRENLQALSTFLRQTYSEEIMSKVIAEDVKKAEHELIITEGVRRPTDVTYLRELPNFHLIAINTDAETRYQRITKRSENPDDKNKTWEQFQEDGAQEAEQKIKEIAAEADVTLDNNGSLKNLYSQIDIFVKKYED
ncbi:MAG: AAA family ATPase [Candidatus Magasanikbacteria bacterium]